ncbi:MAG: diacylglycerol kinase family lipid kinase [Streptococcaceae bacterium]|jgi:YegS/Rv2252/BmrU family lipid kinase|nr:diacylglycerol kinase family lipid kinase [Streptococcaceae bacterium]
MTYYLLANPNSGHRRGHEKVLKLIAHFEATGVQFRFFETTAPNQEKALIAEILSLIDDHNKDQLIIIGGDGTLSLCMKYLPLNLSFSYIPAGSGNDFSRALGISLDPVEAFKSIQMHEATEIYVLGYDSEHLHGFAINNIGIGLDGAIINEANQSGSKKFFNRLHLGQLSYLFTTLSVIFKKKSFTVEIDNSIKFENAFLFTMTKHPYFGGGIKIAPNASNLNEEIELIEVDRIPQRQFFGLLSKVVRGSHMTDPRIHQLVQKNFSVTVSSNQPIQIDGEPNSISADEVLHVWSEKRTIIK